LGIFPTSTHDWGLTLKRGDRRGPKGSVRQVRHYKVLLKFPGLEEPYSEVKHRCLPAFTFEDAIIRSMTKAMRPQEGISGRRPKRVEISCELIDVGDES
jgi:hypothetical protein